MFDILMLALCTPCLFLCLQAMYNYDDNPRGNAIVIIISLPLAAAAPIFALSIALSLF